MRLSGKLLCKAAFNFVFIILLQRPLKAMTITLQLQGVKSVPHCFFSSVVCFWLAHEIGVYWWEVLMYAYRMKWSNQPKDSAVCSEAGYLKRNSDEDGQGDRMLRKFDSKAPQRACSCPSLQLPPPWHRSPLRSLACNWWSKQGDGPMLAFYTLIPQTAALPLCSPDRSGQRPRTQWAGGAEV